MSGARVVAWAWEQDLPPAEKLLLLAIADNAGRGGTWLFGAQKEMAAQTGLGERTVRRHLAALEERGLIRREAVYEFGDRVPDHITLAADGSLPANLAGDDSAANHAELPAKSATGQNGRAQSSSTSRARSLTEKTKEVPGQIGQEALDALPADVRGDVVEMLKQGKAVDRRKVTEAEMSVAAAALAEFNRQAESDYGLGAHLTHLVMRIRERPSWDAAKHVRLVQSAWRVRWWEKIGGGRRPTPAVIYGNAKVFEQVAQDARDEAAGRNVEVADRKGEFRRHLYGGVPFDDLPKSDQRNIIASYQMGSELWDGAEQPVLAHANGNGNGHEPGYTSANFAD